MKILALITVLLSAAAAGCTSVRTDTTETGLWENDLDKMHAACKFLRKLKLDGEVITVNNLKQMGFDLEAPNIIRVSGVPALKRVFSDAAFQDEHGVEGPVFDLEELDKYTGYAIPYRRIETTSGRLYLSELEVTRKGAQAQALLLLKEGKLCYLELYEGTVDTYYSHYAFFEGIIRLMKSPGKAALEITERVHNYTQPGLQYYVPIPID